MPERRALKKGIDLEESRRKREDLQEQIRKDKREDNISKRRNVRGGPGGPQQQQHSADPFDAQQAAASLDRNNSMKAEIAERLRQLPQLIEAVNSSDPQRQLDAVTAFRKLLSIERSPPIEEVIASGVVPQLVRFLTAQDNPALQFEAAWALTNVASGTTKHTQKVIECGAVDIFVVLLRSANEDVREQAVWALGNIAGDSAVCRDLVLQKNALRPLLELCNPHAKVTMLRNATWTLSNFCRGKPQPEFELVKDALPVLARIINNIDDTEVLTDACWALSYLSDDTGPSNAKIQAVIGAGVTQKLVQLLMHPSPNVKTPALRTVGNIVTGDDLQTQQILSMSALPCLLALLTNNKKGIRKEACCTADTQLLTNQGFLSFGSVKQLMATPASAARLLFASYNAAADSIEYHRAARLIEQHVVDEDIVNFTDAAEATRWDTASDKYGRTATAAKQGGRGNGLSLSVTMDHVMYAKTGRRERGQSLVRWSDDFDSREAASLLSSAPQHAVAFRAAATGGMQGSAVAVAARLELDSAAMVNAFLEFYGYWLADGSMRFTADVSYVRAAPIKAEDQAWLHRILRQAGLKLGHGYVLGQEAEMDGQQEFLIKEPTWVDYFTSGYRRHCVRDGARLEEEERDEPEAEEVCSGKWVWNWLWTLGRDQARLVIDGAHRGSGDSSASTICTSSVRFRDELVRLLLHAGLSPSFSLRHAKGSVLRYKSYKTVHGVKKAVYSQQPTAGATAIIAKSDGWSVSWLSARTENVSLSSSGIKVEQYSGLVWCVDVPPHHRIIARRAQESAGVVSRASRPVVIGNCWTISNITAGNTAQIQAVIDAGILKPLVSILNSEEFDIKKEAAWAISNATSGGDPGQIHQLVEAGVIRPMCDLLQSPDAKIIMVALEGIENIIKVGKADAMSSGGVNRYAQMVEADGGLEALEQLQNHDNDDIYTKAAGMIREYWGEEEQQEALPAILPETSQQGFSFGLQEQQMQQQQQQNQQQQQQGHQPFRF